MAKLVLGYWDLKSRGSAVRLMLEYGGVDYEDRLYRNFDHWFKRDKMEMGLDFPNLPYLIDGEVKLTDSNAILRYIGRKIGLEPATEKAQYEADMLDGVVNDLVLTFLLSCFNPDFEEFKPKLREKQDAKLAQLEKFLEGRKYLTGSSLCFVDFLFFQTLDYHRALFLDILEKFPNIEAYVKRFENDKKIEAFLKSDRYRTTPIFAHLAVWGGEEGRISVEFPTKLMDGFKVQMKNMKL